MAYELDTIDVWAAPLEDRPGGLAGRLEALSKAGINLQFVIARRDDPGTGVVFCAPAAGSASMSAAGDAGFAQSESLRSLRITGPDSPGLGAQIARAIAEAGVNLRGMSGAGVGGTAVFFLAFDSSDDAETARDAVVQALA